MNNFNFAGIPLKIQIIVTHTQGFPHAAHALSPNEVGGASGCCSYCHCISIYNALLLIGKNKN